MIFRGGCQETNIQRAEYAVGAMIRFWERQLNGFGDRYVHSCRRLRRQMEIQMQSIPKSAIRIMRWIVGRDNDKLLNKYRYLLSKE